MVKGCGKSLRGTPSGEWGLFGSWGWKFAPWPFDREAIDVRCGEEGYGFGGIGICACVKCAILEGLIW